MVWQNQRRTPLRVLVAKLKKYFKTLLNYLTNHLDYMTFLLFRFVINSQNLTLSI